jgi:hypothetical protein
MGGGADDTLEIKKDGQRERKKIGTLRREGGRIADRATARAWRIDGALTWHTLFCPIISPIARRSECQSRGIGLGLLP